MKRVVIAALVAGVLGPARAADEPSVPTLALGSAAPDFALPGVDGKTHRLKDFAGAKVLAVIFTCNHCPTAQAYEERIKRIVDDYKPKGVAFVAISPSSPEGVRPDELGYTDLDDGFAAMKVRARDSKFNFPYLYGGGEHEATSRAYGPVATPHAFVFDAGRKLRYVGRIDDSEREALVHSRDLRNALDAVLAGKPVALAQTKVFGCSTKWSSKRDSVTSFMDKVHAEPVAVEPADVAALKALKANGQGKLRLVNVWATWCGPCVTEFPDLINMNLNYRHRDFELVTVAAQFPDERDQVLAFLKKQHASTRNLMFGSTDKYKLIDALDPAWDGALPYTVLIDPAGKVLYRRQGPFDELTLRRIIVKALNEIRPWKG
jgi:thiol-disulfide isomerase/thioredoxin